MERILTENKEKRDDLTAITMAIATVQGSWSRATREVLRHNMRVQMGMDEEGLSAPERIIMQAVGRMVDSLMGEGSMADILFKRSVVLPPNDRGVLVLGNLFGVLGSENAHEWKTAALLNQNILNGEPFEKTCENLRKSFEKFNSGVMGMLKKFAAPGENLDEESDGSSVIRHLESIYGGSDETLFAKKKSLEEKLMGDIEKRIGSMTAFEIKAKVETLEIETDDKMISDSLKSAKEIIKESLKKRSREIESIIKTI